MTEQADVILPILQRLQADVAEVKREQKEHRADTAILNHPRADHRHQAAVAALEALR